MSSATTRTSDSKASTKDLLEDACFSQILELRWLDQQSGAPTQIPLVIDTFGKEVVYVLLRDDGVTIKVGVTNGTSSLRWKSIARIFPANQKPSARNHEKKQGAELTGLMRGHVCSLWVKPAHRVKLPYDRSGDEFAVHNAEEEYWDALLEPKFGKALAKRKEDARVKRGHDENS